jgi:hypothetical protein
VQSDVNGDEELYDMRADRHERQNLASDARHTATKVGLRRLRFWAFAASVMSLAPAAEKTRPLVWQLETQAAYRDDYLVQSGYLPVTRFGADPTGVRDATGAIQRCIDEAYRNHLACYFPAGTYLVSGPLRALQRAGEMTDAHALIGGAKHGRRPVIKLRDRTLTGEPTPVVLLQARNPDGQENLPDAYNLLFRGIDLDLGEGNSGAIGVQLHGAQGCAVQDTKISGRGFYAGLKHLAGSGACYGNIEVDGGDYGIDAAQDNAKDPVIAGLVLRHQRVAAFLFDPYTALTVVGFRFEGIRGPLITLKRRTANCTGHLGLIDGVIEMPDATAPALHNIDRSIFLKDVYVRNAAVIVQNDQGPPLAGTPGGWTRVNEYSFFHGPESRLVDGKLGGGELAVSDTVRHYAGAIPADGVTRNLWDEAAFPSPEERDRFVNVADFGADRRNGADAAPAIQRAIDQAAREGKAVFLPKGDYRVAQTIRLRAGTRLIGVSRNLSVLYADNEWQAATDTPMLATDGGADATTQLAFFKLHLGDDLRHRIRWLDWTAGRRSVVREVWFEKRWHASPYAQQCIRISGSGGGRWYGLFTRTGGPASRPPAFRHLLVEGTTEPLHLYAYCPEYALSDCQAEFRRAQNVFVYGLKAETDLKRAHQSPPLWIVDSRNILVCGYTGIGEADAGRGLIELHGRNPDLVLANMGRWRKSAAPEDSWYYVLDVAAQQGIRNALGPAPADSERNVASIFKRGTVTLTR